MLPGDNSPDTFSTYHSASRLFGHQPFGHSAIRPARVTQCAHPLNPGARPDR